MLKISQRLLERLYRVNLMPVDEMQEEAWVAVQEEVKDQYTLGYMNRLLEEIGASVCDREYVEYVIEFVENHVSEIPSGGVVDEPAVRRIVDDKTYYIPVPPGELVVDLSKLKCGGDMLKISEAIKKAIEEMKSNEHNQ